MVSARDGSSILTRIAVASEHRKLDPALRALTLEVAAEARAEWGYASDIIARAFRDHRELSSGGRRRVAEAVYGLIRYDRRLDAILASMPGAPDDLSPVARDEIKLLVHEIREGMPVAGAEAELARLGLSKGTSAGGRIDLTDVGAEDAGLQGKSGLERDATALSYPSWLYERLVNDLGPAEAQATCAAMNVRAPMALRANTVKVSRDELIDRLAEENVVALPLPLAPAGVVLETRVNAFGLTAFRDGLFEVMDEGSQLVAELVAPPPGGRVADVCAGAGGKTLAIAASMDGKGRLLALDTDGRKLEELRRRARRAGLSNVTAREVDDDTRLPDEARIGGWDRVLVDAPCSGVGTLRRNPEARWRLTPQTVATFPPRQLALMVTYAPLVAVGGRLIYATCTILGEENDRVVEGFLAERRDFVRVPVKEIWGRARAEQVGDGLSLQLLPHKHDTDGFYAAVLRRVEK
jgi:16S rRNA (cytosine967-C5)-methyltransferase